MNICAIIPAAGIGSRLGMCIPKILTPITQSITIWSILREKLLGKVDHINVIISPKFRKQFIDIMQHDLDSGFVSLSLQPKPIGMGDAIFSGHSVWSIAKIIIVIWGDQICVSNNTITRSLALHAGKEKSIVLPLTKMAAPYVEYRFNPHQKLIDVKQSREGEACTPNGLSDVGTFVLSVDALFPAWLRFIQHSIIGSQTNELNFLPFLPYLASEGWHVEKIIVPYAIEARGINTTEDLHFFRTLYYK
jgi:bifunctional UDP-N-acetylglucosamine pyrophosphorylase/glucosamine-1-phosphate N-acetyltransferase